MMIYKVKLKALGHITQLPDSQKIFGALIYRLVENNYTNDMIADIFENKKINQVSNVFPDGYLPNLYIWDNKNYKVNIDDEKYNFNNNCYKIIDDNSKPYKGRPYISHENNSYDLDITTTFKDMNSTVEVHDKNEGGVFSQNYLKIMKNGKDKIDFYFLIECSEELHEELFSKDSFNVYRLGPRATRGMNIYEVTNTLKITGKNDGTKFINLGMMGLNNREFIDENESALIPYTSLRKGYQDYKNENVVTYISAGSLICLRGDKNEIKPYHRIKGEERYLYTGGFLLPIKEEKNEVL